jgi:REP element-mobilizing transposase RayT
MRYRDNNNDYLNRYRRNPDCFGGSLLRGNPKGRRPFSQRKALHITMRARVARGRLSMLETKRYTKILTIVSRQAARFGVRVYHFANNGNHLHILVRPPGDRAALANFLRAISGLIARLVLQAEKGAAKRIKFWDRRPFSRIVSWGRAFNACYRYVSRNVLEAVGLDMVSEAIVDIQRELERWWRALAVP